MSVTITSMLNEIWAKDHRWEFGFDPAQRYYARHDTQLAYEVLYDDTFDGLVRQVWLRYFWRKERTLR